MKDIQWNLDQKTAQYILNLITQRPYSEVAELVRDLIQQSTINPNQESDK